MIVGGLDVGTTGCKIALFDRNGKNVKTYYQEYSVSRSNGEHEINLANVKDGVFALLKQACAEFEVTAIGVTSFGETFAMLDETDMVLAPSMLYTDPRGSEQVAYLCNKLGTEYVTGITGVKPHPMYSIGKMMWLKEEKPELYQSAKRILLGEDFMIYSLTGKAVIDYSLAARTAVFDIEKLCWCEDILDAAGIDKEMLSQPVPAGTVAGCIKEDVKKLLGITYDISVVVGCHDQAAAMIGSGVFDKGKAMDGTGTVECIPVILEEKPKNLALYDKGYSVVPFLDGKYACYALSFTGGATLKWFRDTFAEAEAKEFGDAVYQKLDSMVSDNPTGLLILPHFAGAATPYMDNDAKAAMVGLTLETKKTDIYKALMEGTSYEMLLNFNTLKQFTGEIEEVRATGGGARSDVWLQIKADILNTAITSLDCKEVGAAGTAALAGVAIGAYPSLADAVVTMAPIRKIFVPNPEHQQAYSLLYQKYANLYGAIKSL